MGDEETEWPIVVQETDSAHDAGFNVQFDKPYLPTEGLPISEEAGVKAIEDAYDWQLGEGVELTDLPEGGRVGFLVTRDGEHVRTYWEPDEDVQAVLG